MSKRRKYGSKPHLKSVQSNGEVSREEQRPVFDTALHLLRVGAAIIKRLRQKSDAQEIILCAFEEENWTRVIDDPLTVKDGQDAKQRLRRAVDNLNRRQRVPLLRFHVMNQGTSVAWDFREASDGRAT